MEQWPGEIFTKNPNSAPNPRLQTPSAESLGASGPKQIQTRFSARDFHKILQAPSAESRDAKGVFPRKARVRAPRLEVAAGGGEVQGRAAVVVGGGGGHAGVDHAGEAGGVPAGGERACTKLKGRAALRREGDTGGSQQVGLGSASEGVERGMDVCFMRGQSGMRGLDARAKSEGLQQCPLKRCAKDRWPCMMASCSGSLPHRSRVSVFAPCHSRQNIFVLTRASKRNINEDLADQETDHFRMSFRAS